MERNRLFTRAFARTTLLSGMATLCLFPILATSAESQTPSYRGDQVVAKVTITMSSRGITAAPGTLKGGYYLLTIRNRTSDPRGLEMVGIDKALSPTLRYTKVLQPGKSEAFQWYFAKGKTVYARDVMSWAHGKRGATTVTFGRMRKAIDVN